MYDCDSVKVYTGQVAVKVCQNVISYHDGGYGSSDDAYEYAGSYAVKEGYADPQGRLPQGRVHLRRGEGLRG
jgi:hypothetical protein